MKTVYLLLIFLILVSSCHNDANVPCDDLPVDGNSTLIIFSEVRGNKNDFIQFFRRNIAQEIKEQIRQNIYRDSFRLKTINIYLHELSSDTDGAPAIAEYTMTDSDVRNCCYSEQYIDHLVINKLQKDVEENYQQKKKGIRVMPSLARIADRVRDFGMPPSEVSVFYFSDMLEETADIAQCGWYNFCKKGYDPVLIDKAAIEEAEQDWDSGCMDNLVAECQKWIEGEADNIEVFVFRPHMPRQMADHIDGSHRDVRNFWKNRFNGVRTFSFK